MSAVELRIPSAWPLNQSMYQRWEVRQPHTRSTCHRPTVPSAYITVLFWPSVSSIWKDITARAVETVEGDDMFPAWTCFLTHGKSCVLISVLLILPIADETQTRALLRLPFLSLMHCWALQGVEYQTQPLPWGHFPSKLDVHLSVYEWLYRYEPNQGEGPSTDIGEQKVLASHAWQGKLHFRESLFFFFFSN